MARILVAEDEAALRDLVARGLRAAGHTVTAVADGGAAMEAFTRDSGQFDLLLADIKMPVMDGIALALATAQTYPALPILLMTGYAEQRERAHGLDTLIRGVLTKPFTLVELQGKVAEAMTAA